MRKEKEGAPSDHLQDREDAVKILVRVEEGAFADRLLERVNPAVRALVKGVLQELGSIDAELAQHSHRDLEELEPRVAAILRCGALQIMFNPDLPKALVVNESVLLTKELLHSGAAGVVNAVLRKVSPGSAVKPQSAALKNFPEWISDRWVGFFGFEFAAGVASALCEKPRLFFRANTDRVTPSELIQSLKNEGVTGKSNLIFPESIEIELGAVKELAKLSAYQEGLFAVQDLSETIVGHVVAPNAGQRILDMCAGPGGKTSHLCQLSKGQAEVVAIDINAKRAELVRKNLARLGISGATVLDCDAFSFHQDKLFDVVLLDGPCSGSGVFNKKVDSRWKLQPEELAELIELQFKLLKKALSLVRPGGRVVYSTCSIEPDENDLQIERIIKEGAKEEALPASLGDFVAHQPAVSFTRHGLTTYPNVHQCAGGYVAIISRP
jgi:16S rRNA (cytosine967-C5)-methyltransferase